MDVEKIQKINDLALRLQQQGSFDREEAVKQAEQMLSKNSKLEVSEISNQKVEEIDQKPKTNLTWQEAMEKNTKFIVNEFKDIQKEIINLKAEITNLNHKIKNMQLAPAPQPKPPEQQKSAAPEQKKIETPQQETHPRQGDCKSEDFTVEKMFYCGSK